MKTYTSLLNEVLARDKQYIPQDFREYKEPHILIQKEIVNKNISKKNILTALDIPESVGYKYINGTRAIPRDYFIKFMIFFNYDLKQIQYSLIHFGYASLYLKNKRDSAIIHAIVNDYSYLQLKEYFEKYGISKL